MSKEDLINWLKDHQMSNDRFAYIIGVSSGAVMHWIRGRREIPETVKRLCVLFDNHPELMGEFANAGS